MAKIDCISIYPIKGFPAYSLKKVGVQPDHILVDDRRFAFALKPQAKGSVEWLSKGKLLQILNTNPISGFDAEFEPTAEGDWVIEFKSGDFEGSYELPSQGEELAKILSEKYNLNLTFLDGQNSTAFADQKKPKISMLNLASVRDMEQKSGVPISWQRLRGNLMVESMPAWEENHLVGERVLVGEAEFEVVELVGRCAAPGVNMQGVRDIDLLDFMLHTYRHTDCGLFLKSLNEAGIKKGDPVRIA